MHSFNFEEREDEKEYLHSDFEQDFLLTTKFLNLLKDILVF
ncbi:hypothetical protein SAMN03080601_01728 [Alkalitalea saponilacus]|uniref:Uncharacterized protein n=1 Tax=Alkalitalea saponilacus TaxID=889453 RepID=A0A1T5G4V1_9BACT|nr:hypothetical protein SAMN03080601_01728 [Alkalitalea saponilacus]